MSLNVVVTGASTGIGRAIALRLSAAGHRTFASVRKAEDAAALVRAGSGELYPILLDVTDAASINRAAGEVAELLGDAPLNGLVNNAGVGIVGPLEYIKLADLRNQLEVNVVGVVAVTQAFLPLLRRGPGRIVNIGSMNGRIATPFIGAYCASKYALEAITDTLRMELAPWKIDASVIEPGPIESSIWDKSRRQAEQLVRDLPEEARERYAPEIASMSKIIDRSERAAVPADRVASAVEHALSARRPKTRYMVGPQARVLSLLRGVLPDRKLDWAIRRALGLRRA
jgi:NAD(P)-dependent dehydrogenase (short-subunit alcohol dehydrogenase family)